LAVSIENYLVGFGLIAGVILSSVTGLLIVRRLFLLERLRRCHEVAGYLLSVVGTMYAVLLGLIVVDAMSNFQTARTVVEADVFLLAERLPEEKARRVRSLCDAYVADVIGAEWLAMARGGISLAARGHAIKLMKEVTDFEPVTKNQKALYPLLLQEAFQLWDSRRARTNIALYGVPAIEWFVLVLGGVVTVVFTYFFSLDSTRAQVAMTTMVSLLISLNVYLVALFGAPFSGDLQVRPEAFEVDQMIFRNQLGLGPHPEPWPES
jgi:Protein of unknown function (DUF4239)